MTNNADVVYPNVFTDEQIKTTLSRGIHKVTFVKKDGTNRTMVCTRDPVFIPKDLREQVVAASRNSKAIPVWVTDECFWRSFNSYQVENIEKAS